VHVLRIANHAVLVLDKPGWHTARRLMVPENISLVYLPAYSPELNPVERVWLYLRKRFLSSIFDTLTWKDFLLQCVSGGRRDVGTTPTGSGAAL
jgi:transposase